MSYLNFILAAKQWGPEEVGRAIGSALVLSVMLLLIIKCITMMRRTTTSSLCVTGLLLAVSGWFICALGNAISDVLGIRHDVIRMGFGVIGVLMLLAALVVGIVGLSIYDRNRYKQGRTQAIWAIVLGSIVALIMVGSIITRAVAISSRTIAEENSSPNRERGGVIKNVEFNFSLTPSASWAEFNPKVVNEAACLVIRRIKPEVYGMVIAERFEETLELDHLLEIAKSNLAMSTEVLNQTEERVELNGLTFARFNSRVAIKGSVLPMEFEHWLVVQHGFSWQIAFWTQGDRTVLSREARDIMETFRVLDPTLTGSRNQGIEDVERPELGYSTKLDGMGWSQWTYDAGNLMMDFQAQRFGEALVVLPLRFENKPPDLAALTRGLFSSLSFEDTPEEEFSSKSWDPGHGGTGREFGIDRDVDGDRFRYILRVARTENSAHLVAGWWSIKNGDGDMVRRSLDAITLSVPKGDMPELSPAQKIAFGIILNESAFSLVNRGLHENAAEVFFEGYKQANDPIVLSNAADMYERAELAVKGRDLIAPHLEKFPTNHQLGLPFARLQILSGDVSGGEARFLNLVENGLKDEDSLLSWLQLLNQNNHYPSAIKSADAWVLKSPSINARRWQAQTYSASGDSEKAIEILTKLHEENPADRGLGFDLGEVLNDGEQYDMAAVLAEKLLEDGTESPRALLILGWSQMGKKWYRDAKATFERAAKVQPEDESITYAIRMASSELGQGDNTSIKTSIKAVELPKEVAAALAAVKSPEDLSEGHMSVWLMRATGYHFEKGKPLRRTIFRRAKILNVEGAKNFSTVEANFHPLGERVFMNRLEVKDAEGNGIAQASVNDAYVRDLNDGIASDEKVLHMQVAGVRPGCTVEWEVTYEDLAPSDSFDFQRHLFAYGTPFVGEAVFVTGDIEAVQAQLNHGTDVDEIKKNGLMAWIVKNQPAATFESLSLLFDERCPVLLLGEKGVTWEKVGKDYLEQIESRLSVDPAIKKQAEEMIAGMTDDRQKIATIVRHVQKEIVYKAIEFGERARRPNAAEKTVHLRYGDCKDTSLLIHLLLKAVGIKSHLVLVNTNWKVHDKIPTLDQFNHMVVNVPSLGKNWLIDATDKTLALSVFPADGLWHSHALILDPAGSRLISPPSLPELSSCKIVNKREVSIEGDDWHVKEKLSLTGYYGSWMRAAFTGLSPIQQQEKVQGMLENHGMVQVEKFHFENLDALDEPASFSVHYHIRNSIAEGSSGSLPALWERDYLSTRFIKDRKTPFELLYPFQLTSETTVKLPASAQEKTLKALSGKGKSDFSKWDFNSKASGDDVILRFDFTSNPGKFAASQYLEFHEDREAARRVLITALSWNQTDSSKVKE